MPILQKRKTRSEQEVFNDLETLCKKPGYIHAIAFLCFRDNNIQTSDKATIEDLFPLYNKERLNRKEIGIILGLLIKSEIMYVLPTPEVLNTMIEDTDKLLEELHSCISSNLFINKDVKSNLFETNPSMMREPILYGSDTAFYFQYRDIAKEKYLSDNKWFLENLKFSVDEVHKVMKSLEIIYNKNIYATFESFIDTHPQSWTILPGYEFSINDIFVELKESLSISKIKSILDKFSINDLNQSFNCFGSYNSIHAYPLIKKQENIYIMFQYQSLTEAFYETPYYWFLEDKKYKNQASDNRGEFTEDFTYKQLINVFGEENVFKNIEIVDKRGNVKGEIDVLVTFSDRAIIIQAKSKKLTVKSRLGDSGSIESDFNKAIQYAYNQGELCATSIENIKYNIIDSKSNIININRNFKEIYIVCIVSDHYPALNFQSYNFLKYKIDTKILPPFVMDVFFLDVMCEFLNNPLYFLSYLNKRAIYNKKILAPDELTILSYHLIKNLYLGDDLDGLMIEDDVSTHLDLSMISRRTDFNGPKTPEGILTKFKGTFIGSILEDINDKSVSSIIDLGFMLLNLSQDTIEAININTLKIIELAKKDRLNHDFTVGIANSKSGLTIHCNFDPIDESKPRLFEHCARRKYTQKTNEWFGICINPNTQNIEYGIKLKYEWEESDELNQITSSMKKGKSIKDPDLWGNSKVGRNDKCPCGSGKKYKKCCLR